MQIYYNTLRIIVKTMVIGLLFGGGVVPAAEALSVARHHYTTGQSIGGSSSTSMQLHYRNEEPNLMDERPSTTTFLGLRLRPVSMLSSTSSSHQQSSAISAAKKQDSETSRMVDEYLEFLDRRYRRVRGHSAPSSSSVDRKRTVVNPLSWILSPQQQQQQQSSVESLPAPPRREEENALYALGVAGLASERLLQKHSLRKPIKKETQSSGSSPSSLAVSTRSSMILRSRWAALFVAVAQFSKRVVKQTVLPLSSSVRKNVSAAKKWMNPRLVMTSLWTMGIDNRAVVAFCLVLYMARPIIQGLISTGTSGSF